MNASKALPQRAGQTLQIKRRSLLLGLGAAAAAVGAAPIGSDVLLKAARAGQPAAADMAANASQESGYRLTDHVRAYYRSARM